MKISTFFISALIVVLATGFGGWWLGKSQLFGGPDDVADFHRDSLERVPNTTMVMTSFDFHWVLSQLIDHNVGIVPVRKDPDDLWEQLGELSKDYYGVNLFEAGKATVWVGENGEGIWLEGPFDGDLAGDEEEGMVLWDEVYAAKSKEGLYLGPADSIQEALNEDSLDKNELAELHEQALEATGGGSFVMTGAVTKDFSANLDDEVRGLRGGGLAVNGNSISAALIGKEKTLERLMKLVNRGRKEAKKELKADFKNAEDDENGPAVLGFTFLRHKLDHLYESFELEQNGDLLTFHTAVPRAGLGLVSAVPFYLSGAGLFLFTGTSVKRKSRAKTSAAIDELDKQYKASSVYYTGPPSHAEPVMPLTDDELKWKKKFGTPEGYEEKHDEEYDEL